MATRPVQPVAAFTPHQERIAKLVALGFSNSDIAAKLQISVAAVKSALFVIFEKTGVRNRVELVNTLSQKSGLECLDSSGRHEQNRLKAVEALEARLPNLQRKLDELVFVTAVACNTPIALLSIVQEKRLWFVSRWGLQAEEATRKASFCDLAAQSSHLFEVPDALQDVRFRDHSLVIAPPRLRLYAGIPVITEDGYALGTLCVIDRIARALSPQQRQALAVMEKLVLEVLAGTTPLSAPGQAPHTSR